MIQSLAFIMLVVGLYANVFGNIRMGLGLYSNIRALCVLKMHNVTTSNWAQIFLKYRNYFNEIKR